MNGYHDFHDDKDPAGCAIAVLIGTVVSIVMVLSFLQLIDVL